MTQASVLWVGPTGAEHHALGDVKALLEREDGFVWVDVTTCDDEALTILSDVFDFHPRAVGECQTRSHLPKVHLYPDHLFLVLHDIEPGDAGHVHLLELDQFVSTRYLVTVHGPLGEGVSVECATRETRAIAARLEAGRYVPTAPAELCYAIVSGILRHNESLISSMATRIAALERRIMSDEVSDPERTLEEIFRERHELVTLRTVAAQGHEVAVRMAALARVLPQAAHLLVDDIADQYDRLTKLADGEKEFLQGVLDFYESRTATKMNIAMERLALLTAILLPITALSGIYGMNIIVNDRTDPRHLAFVVASMVLVVVLTFRWARRQGWW